MIANLFGGDGLFVLVIALVVLVGGSQLPKIARNVGLAGKEFRKAQAESEAEAAHARVAQAQNEASVPTPLPAAPIQPAATQPVATQPAASAAAPVAAPPQPAAAAGPEQTINLTPSQLDALLKAREEQVRGGTGAG